MRLDSGSEILTAVFPYQIAEPAPRNGTGNAGNITIDASQLVNINGAINSNDNTPIYSAISSVTYNSGSAGDVNLSTSRLSITNGGLLGSTIYTSPLNRIGQELPGNGTGNGGNINIKASESIEVVGTAPPSLLLAASYISTYTFAFGNAGNTLINTPKLTVLDGGQVNSTTSTSGNAGKVTINAPDSILVSGTKSDGEPSDISASGFKLNDEILNYFGLPPNFSGNTGELTINTGRLTVQDGARVGVQHQGTGNAGKFQLNATDVLLQRGGFITGSTASGQGGNVILNVQDSLQLRHSGEIIVDALGSVGDGGNLTINSGTIAAIEGSTINANAVRGSGGNILITTTGLFLSPDSNITASSQFGISGNVKVNTPDLKTSAELIELPQQFADASHQIIADCTKRSGDTFKITRRGGLSDDPSKPFNSEDIWQDYTDYTSQVLSQNSANSSARLTTPTLPVIREVTGWQINEKGEIVLSASGPNSPLLADRPRNCQGF